jgi:hypothetical protein
MSKLLWVPADLPLFLEKKELVEKFHLDYVNDKKAKAFDSQQFTEHTDSYEISPYKQEYLESHKYLIDYITENMPYTDIVNIKIHHQSRQGKTHIDFGSPDKNIELFNHNNSVEPCGYRMVIAGVRQGQLYVERNDGSRVYPTLPESTDWYILGHTNVPHGLDGVDTNRYIIFCHAWIDKEKHDEIVKRSLEKYGDYCVYDLE